MTKLQKIQTEVEGLVKATGTLDRAEELIDKASGLDRDERAALWLYAWSLLPRRYQREEAKSHLLAVSLLRN